MNPKELATKVVDQMYNNDPFSQWLGIERVEDGVGTSLLRMAVTKEMLNGFGIAHGGITYSLADSALAFASNSYGEQCVSVETSISHTKAVKEGDVLTAIAKEANRTNKTSVYEITVFNQDNETVAIFRGNVYNTRKEWFPQ
ncbi:MAG TPA: hotdog fold thioesterase [Flavobacteriales bacterium]|nr:hotdog fold thioesterase [Flavobacteriales bacterium]